MPSELCSFFTLRGVCGLVITCFGQTTRHLPRARPRCAQTLAFRYTRPCTRHSAPTSPVPLSGAAARVGQCPTRAARRGHMMGTALGRIDRPNRSRRPRRVATPTLSLPTGEDEDGPECPVCMNALGAQTFAFPCGHCVCSGCDVQLQQRGFYACPTCREPREGVTRAQVDAAATARVRRDELSEYLPSGAGFQGPSSFVEHNGHTLSLIHI